MVDLNDAVDKWEDFINAAVKLAIYFEIRNTVELNEIIDDLDATGRKLRGISKHVIKTTDIAEQNIDAAMVFKIPGLLGGDGMGEEDKLYGYKDAAALKAAVGEDQPIYSLNAKHQKDISKAVKKLTNKHLALLTNASISGNPGRFYPNCGIVFPGVPSLDMLLLVGTLKRMYDQGVTQSWPGAWNYVNSMLDLGSAAEASDNISLLGARTGASIGPAADTTTRTAPEPWPPEVLYPGLERVAKSFEVDQNGKIEAFVPWAVTGPGELVGYSNTPVTSIEAYLPFMGQDFHVTSELDIGPGADPEATLFAESQRFIQYAWPRTHQLMYNEVGTKGRYTPIPPDPYTGIDKVDTGWGRPATENEFITQIAMVILDSKDQPKIDAKFKEFYHSVIVGIMDSLKAAVVEKAIGEALGMKGLPDVVEEKNTPAPTPFDFQCFLMENIDMLTAYQEKNADYKSVIRLLGDPGTTISKINHAAKSDAVNALLNLTPAVQAALVPYIKIYRVDYDPNPEKMFRPLRQQELPIPNFVDGSNIEQLAGKGFGRYEGFGLKSFNWSLDGLQPETVTNNISANLTFYFQSVQDVFKGSWEEGYGNVAGRRLASPLDLLISSRTKERAAKEEAEKARDPNKRTGGISCTRKAYRDEFDGANYRIKVIAGWATPPNIQELLPPNGGLKKKALVRALRNTRISLYLHQTRHKLDFKQDGTVELSIDYQAALTGILTSPSADILGARTGEMKDKFKQIDLDLEKDQKFLDDFEEIPGGDNSELTITQEAMKKKLKERKKLENEEKLKKYKRFLSMLYGRTPANEPVELTPKMQTLQVNPIEFLLPRLGDIEDAEERAGEALRKMSPNNSRGFVLLPPGRTLSGGCAEEGSSDQMLEAVTDALATGEPIDLVREGEIFEEKWDQKLSGENIYIPFFFLGDLIDSIMQNNQDVFSASDTQTDYMTFLGGADIINPLLLFQTANLEDVACADNVDSLAMTENLRDDGYVFTTDANGSIKKRVNIGSFPISLDVFNIWFKDNVIKPGKSSYYLIHFLKDMCGLISQALGKACYGKNAFNPIRFDTSIVQFQNSKNTIFPGSRCLVNTLAEAKGTLDDTNDIAPEELKDPLERKKFSSVAGLVLYSTDAKPQSRSGDYSEDLNDGIYHNYIGSSAGILKKINFSRIEQQYLREAKIQKKGALGAAQLRELYSVNMEMVGNTLFKNGQYTFVWPTAINTDDYLAELLGIGGYFMIKGVKHTITPGGYTVSVSALQEGLRYMGGTSVLADQLDDVLPGALPQLNQRLLGRERPDTESVGGTLQNFAEEEFGMSISNEHADWINEQVTAATPAARSAAAAMRSAARYVLRQTGNDQTLEEALASAKANEFSRVTESGADLAASFNESTSEHAVEGWLGQTSGEGENP